METATVPVSLLPLHQLLRRIVSAQIAPPVRLMEEVLRRDSKPVVRELVRLLSDGGLGVPWSSLWPIVLLGQLRDPRSAPALSCELGLEGEPYPWTALAAAEALAALGGRALPRLDRPTQSDDERCRIYAYAALGWIGTDEARAMLLAALAWEREAPDALACALADAACEEAIEPLYDALHACPPFQRGEIIRQIQRLHRREARFSPAGLDWRLRYRPRGRQVFEGGWPHRLRSLREHPSWRELSLHGPAVPPLEVVFAAASARSEPERPCALCERASVRWTGLGACEEHATHLVQTQIELLEDAAENAGGGIDLFDVLHLADSCLSGISIVPLRLLIVPGDAGNESDEEEDEEEAPSAAWNPGFEWDPWVVQHFPTDWAPELESPEPQSGARAQAAASLRAVRDTCHWLIEQGIEYLGPARVRLRAELPGTPTISGWGGRLLASGDAAGVGEDLLGLHAAEAGPRIEIYRESIEDVRCRARLDRYYRAWLDQPLEALRGRTPRTAPRSLHNALEKLVSGFEAAEAQRSEDGAVPYDFAWLRRALQLDE